MADLNEDLNSFASEHSFVILGQGSLTLDDDNRQSPTSHQYNSRLNSQSNSLHTGDDTPYSRPCCPSPNEIQSKLDRLVKENILLKETLNHSNLAMKNQFDTLALWHEEVVKTHESHKQKFLETQEHIKKLQNENVDLKKLIQQNLNKCTGNNPASTGSDKESTNTSIEMGDVSGKEVNSNCNYTNDLSLKNTELERKLSDMTEEKSEMEKKLKILVEEISQLKSDKQNYDKCIQCQGVMNSSTVRNSDVKKEESSNEASLEPDMSIIERLSGHVETDSDASEMREEIALMKQRLADGLKSWEENNVKMKELRIQNEEMTKIKDKLEDEVKSYKSEVEKLKEETDRFSEELKKKDELLEKKNQELEETKKNIKDLEMMCENIAILETQVELYRKDFNEERKAREDAIAEKEKFAELLRSVGRLQQNEERKKSGASSSSSKNQEELKHYLCPKCWKRFSELKECEDHVNDCLNIDMFP